MDIHDLEYNIVSAYDFILNTKYIQKDKETYKSTEQERDDTVAEVLELYGEKNRLQHKLNQIHYLVVKDLVVKSDKDILYKIKEIIDGDVE